MTTGTTAAHRFRLERAAASPDEEPRWFLEKTGVDPATSDWLKGPGRLSEVRSELERELGSKVAAKRVLKEYEDRWIREEVPLSINRAGEVKGTLPEGVRMTVKPAQSVRERGQVEIAADRAVDFVIRFKEDGPATDVRMTSDEPGNVRLSGAAPGSVLRTGMGAGSAVRDGTGAGDARREGGDGNAVRKGGGAGSAIRTLDGDGDAVRAGQGNGEAVRKDGSGAGNAVRTGWGDGGARRAGGGTGNAVVDSAGAGSATVEEAVHGNAIRAGSGSGDAFVTHQAQGNAVIFGKATGTATNQSDAPGDAKNHSSGAGNAERSGTGSGDAVRVGSGNGDAERSGAGEGNAWRDGPGAGDARNTSRARGHAARTGHGPGTARREGPGGWTVTEDPKRVDWPRPDWLEDLTARESVADAVRAGASAPENVPAWTVGDINSDIHQSGETFPTKAACRAHIRERLDGNAQREYGEDSMYEPIRVPAAKEAARLICEHAPALRTERNGPGTEAGVRWEDAVEAAETRRKSIDADPPETGARHYLEETSPVASTRMDQRMLEELVRAARDVQRARTTPADPFGNERGLNAALALGEARLQAAERARRGTGERTPGRDDGTRMRTARPPAAAPPSAAAAAAGAARTADEGRTR